MTEQTEVVIAGRYKFVAVNDDRDFCECCGRKGLKRVVWVLDAETEEVKHFGTTCALSPSKAFGLEREIKRAIRDADHKEKVTCRLAHIAYRRAGGKTESASPGRWRCADMGLFDRCYQEARHGLA